MGKYVDQLDAKIQLVDKKYRREQYQSYMTASEWRNVELASEFAAFLRDKKSMFQYPYFRQAFDVWKIAYKSYAAARKYNSFKEIIFSEYIFMDLLIAFFSTLELIPRGIISLFISPFLNKENTSEMQGHFADYFEQYTKDLQSTPFYEHDYDKVRADLAEKYKQCTKITWGDWFSWKVISTELWFRKWVSKPLNYWFHLEGNETAATTDVLVKFKAVDAENAEEAKQQFQQQLDALAETHQVSLVNKHLYVKEETKTADDGTTYTSVYAQLNTPRYKSFIPLVRELGENGIQLRKIAGNAQVQVKCNITAETTDLLMAREEALKKTKNVTPLYGYGDRIHPTQKTCFFDVPVRNLHKTLRRLEKEPEVQVNFIHNF